MNGWGQSVFARFEGSSAVSVKLKGNGLYYSYRIDNGPWKKIQVRQGTVTLATGLSKKDVHTLHFGKSDEASYGTMIFYDLVLDQGYTALDPEAPKLTFEAIGDSITAGFKADCLPGGKDSSGKTCIPSQSNEDQYETYVAHLADTWGTDDWSVVARSGIGIGNVVGAGGTSLEEYKCSAWTELTYNRCKEWDFSAERRQPDVIMVNLGTNDYAFGNPALFTFQSGYVELVKFVRSKHPHATIFCLCPLQYSLNGPLGGSDQETWDGVNSTAQGRDKKWETMRDGVRGAVKQLGDPKVVYVPTGTPDDPWMDGASEYSDWTHPTVDGHTHFAKLLADVLTPIIRRNHPLALPMPGPMLV